MLLYISALVFSGIRALYEDAHSDPERIYLYFHSKGMVYHKKEERSPQEWKLMKEMLFKWEQILDVFSSKPNINKVCYGTSPEGWCWFNFFWARGMYIKNHCPPPAISKDRITYEMYLGECTDNSYTKSYNIESNGVTRSYDMAEIGTIFCKDIDCSQSTMTEEG